MIAVPLHITQLGALIAADELTTLLSYLALVEIVTVVKLNADK